MMLTPANVVKGCRRIEVHCGQHAIGDQRVETSTLVHFIEVRKRATREQLVSLLILDWRTICIVQQTLDQVRSGNTILQPLLVLNANCIAAETCSDAESGDIHFALLEDLSIGEVCLRMWAGDEVEAYC